MDFKKNKFGLASILFGLLAVPFVVFVSFIQLYSLQLAVFLLCLILGSVFAHIARSKKEKYWKSGLVLAVLNLLLLIAFNLLLATIIID